MCNYFQCKTTRKSIANIRNIHHAEEQLQKCESVKDVVTTKRSRDLKIKHTKMLD